MAGEGKELSVEFEYFYGIGNEGAEYGCNGCSLYYFYFVPQILNLPSYHILIMINHTISLAYLPYYPISKDLLSEDNHSFISIFAHNNTSICIQYFISYSLLRSILDYYNYHLLVPL